MLGITYVYMPSIPDWVSTNPPQPEPKSTHIPPHRKTKEYWFKFYMGEDLSEFEEPTPEPEPEPEPLSKADKEEADKEYEGTIYTSWPMTPEEIEAWQNKPISKLPPYYGASKKSQELQESQELQSAQADFAAAGPGGATSVASPPTTAITSHHAYHWPFPTRDTASLNFALTQTTLKDAGTISPTRRITLHRYVTPVTRPAAASQTSAFLLHPSAFSKAERPPPDWS